MHKYYKSKREMKILGKENFKCHFIHSVSHSFVYSFNFLNILTYIHYFSTFINLTNFTEHLSCVKKHSICYSYKKYKVTSLLTVLTKLLSWVWTQVFALARTGVTMLEPCLQSIFALVIFGEGILWTICQCWPWTRVLLISVSWLQA
jgi:hypothetical protein